MRNAFVLATALAATVAGASAGELPGGGWTTFTNGGTVAYSVDLGSVERTMKDGLPTRARVLIHREGGDKKLEPYAFDGMEFDCRGHYRFALWGSNTKPEPIEPGTLASRIEDAACWGAKP